MRYIMLALAAVFIALGTNIIHLHPGALETSQEVATIYFLFRFFAVVFTALFIFVGVTEGEYELVLFSGASISALLGYFSPMVQPHHWLAYGVAAMLVLLIFAVRQLEWHTTLRYTTAGTYRGNKLIKPFVPSGLF